MINELNFDRLKWIMIAITATILLACISHTSIHAQTVQDDITPYVHDSSFAIQSDSTCPNYVDIKPITFNYNDAEQCTRVLITHVDYWVSSGNSVCYYTMQSADGHTKYEQSFTINNQTTNDMVGYMVYGLKFVYWRISELANLTIE